MSTPLDRLEDCAAPTRVGDPAGNGRISDELEAWFDGEGDNTLGKFTEFFQEKGFALLFILLLGPSALPIPTGGVTNVLEVIAVLVAAQLVVGRDQIWIPKRWRKLNLGGRKQRRVINGLIKLMRRLERFSQPRFQFLFNHRLSNSVFGVLVIVFTAGSFFAPPFSGLDTIPALGVVLVSIGVLLEDMVIVAAGIFVGICGLALELVLGKAAADAVRGIV